MPTAVRSHTKINLGLHIGATRADGFHGLATVYQTLELFDIVTVTACRSSATSITLTSNDSRVPTDGRNTAWKMVELALESLSLTADVQIHIEKRLPVQGGLGAGSANAVAALVGLEVELGIPGQIESATAGPSAALRCAQDDSHLWRERQPGARAPSLRLFPGARVGSLEGWQAERLELAAKVGSDVPFFLIGGTILGSDRGQIVAPLPDIDPLWCVVAVPAVGVSTPQAFGDWDTLCEREGLTPKASHAKLSELSRAYVSAFGEAIPKGQQGAGSSGVLSVGENLAGPQESALVRTGISSLVENDFERVVFPQHPSLAEIKRILAAPGTPEAASLASLSGSGSALFGLYQTRGDAEAACARLHAAEATKQVATHITRTLPRERYWSEMLLPQGL